MRLPLLLALSLAACVGDKGGLVVHNSDPEANIESPADGTDVLEGAPVTLRGVVGDRETDPEELTATWLVNGDVVCDGEADPDADGLTTCTIALDDDAEIMLVAYDSKSASGEDRVAVTVTPNAPPEIAVSAPVADGFHLSTQPVALAATVSDAEDDPTDLDVVWTVGGETLEADGASLDSAGEFAATAELPAGTHTLTATVTDTLGKTGTDTVTIDVIEDIGDPLCSLTAPAEGAVLPPGSDVTIEGSVYDTDTPISELRATLESDVDGELVTAVSLDTDGDFAEVVAGLSDGPHVLTLTAWDAVGHTCEATVSIGLCDAVWYRDADADGHGDAADSVVACAAPSGFVALDDDCDDTNAGVSPSATEVCDADDVDEDCDGLADDADASADSATFATWYADSDGDTYGDAATNTPACDQPTGFVADATDCDGIDAAVSPAATEVCDTIDNDCDGAIDDADASVDPTTFSTFYADSDGDTYGDAGTTADACDAPSGFVADSTDCDDTTASVNPGATEVCDTADTDEDCDGLSDDADSSVDSSTYATWYADSDSDTYGDPSSTTDACDEPTGFVADDADCDDTESAIHPGAAEICDAADTDEDCDGLSDDADSSVDSSTYATWYADSDSDTYGDPSSTTDACDAPSGFVSDDTDCDDADATIHPAATEICDGDDNDCDGDIDDDDASVDPASLSTWWADTDGDTYGDASSTTQACNAPSGWVANDSDCDDTDASVYALETWYDDTDGDGYGDDSTGASWCGQPSGTVGQGGDCDDASALSYPGATELCDGEQNDCDATSWTSDAGLVSFYDDTTGAWSDVTSTWSAGTTSSPAAITLADAGQLNLCEGTWYANVEIQSDVDLVGVDGAALVELHGGGSDTVITVLTDNISVGLSDLTVTGGTATRTASYTTNARGYGGGLFCEAASSLDLEGLVVEGNAADHGGGIYAYGCDVTADAVEWLDNTADYNGAGVFVAEQVWVEADGWYEGNSAPAQAGARWSNCTVTLTDTTFSANDATVGGSAAFMARDGTTLSATGLTVTDNDSGTNASGGTYYGGAVWFYTNVTATLTDATFEDNDSDHLAGALYLYDADVTCTDCTFDTNTALGSGGAAYVRTGSSLTIDGTSAATANASDTSGGAFYVSDSELSLDGTTLSGNIAYHSAAINAEDSTVTLTAATVSGNTADTNSGGVRINGTASVGTISTTTFSGNTASDGITGGGGGALTVRNGATVDVSDSTFTGNTALNPSGGMNGGGALWAWSGSSSNTLVLDAVTFDGNTSAAKGGAAWLHNSDVTMTDSTISTNEADENGGGLYVRGSALELDTVTLTSNVAAEHGAGIYFYDSTFDITDSSFQSNTATTGHGAAFYVNLSTGDIVRTRFYGNGPEDTYHAASADRDNWSSGGATFSCTTTSCY